MIALLGDIHQGTWRLQFAAKQAAEMGAAALIQVGDFGFDGATVAWLRRYHPPLPIIVIDGNHEDHSLLPLRVPTMTSMTDLSPEHEDVVWFAPRGMVATIGGKRIGFLGGADSVDKDIRNKYGWHWSPDEVITREDVRTLLANADGQPLDLLVTHSPPQEVIEKEFSRESLRQFGLDPSWTSESAVRLDHAWEALGKPILYCGHMHKTVYGPNYRILDIGELALVSL